MGVQWGLGLPGGCPALPLVWSCRCWMREDACRMALACTAPTTLPRVTLPRQNPLRRPPRPFLTTAGDEVDPGLIVPGGRRARRGRGGGESRPKYSAQAQLDSDEDEW